VQRRAFLAGTGAVLLAAPLAAEAQQAGKVWRIGFLSPGYLPPAGPRTAPALRPLLVTDLSFKG